VENVDVFNTRDPFLCLGELFLFPFFRYNELVLEEKKGKEKPDKKKEGTKARRKTYCLYVMMTLTHGDRIIGEPMYTCAKLYSNNPTWGEWIVMPIKLRSIPRVRDAFLIPSIFARFSFFFLAAGCPPLLHFVQTAI
jgi:hypothetical protein